MSNRTFCGVQYVAMSTWNVAGVTEELNFKIYLIFINLNLKFW